MPSYLDFLYILPLLCVKCVKSLNPASVINILGGDVWCLQESWQNMARYLKQGISLVSKTGTISPLINMLIKGGRFGVRFRTKDLYSSLISAWFLRATETLHFAQKTRPRKKNRIDWYILSITYQVNAQTLYIKLPFNVECLQHLQIRCLVKPKKCSFFSVVSPLRGVSGIKGLSTKEKEIAFFKFF